MLKSNCNLNNFLQLRSLCRSLTYCNNILNETFNIIAYNFTAIHFLIHIYYTILKYNFHYLYE